MTSQLYLLPREKFPLVIEFLHHETEEVVYRFEVREPDAFQTVPIPALRAELGHPVAVRITFADGEVQNVEAPLG